MTPEAIKSFRESRGWSQARLAEELGIDQTTVSRIETGATEPSKPVARLLQFLMSEPAPVEGDAA
ncbi:MAG: helix-turn-helix domain-containing protein [Rhizobiaceae bacterium]|nr:helix-turn-helix domain-containing protein [Rhizobiaceae bacterium]MCV0408912.1 helix-turn-helix domain-containing protein [Rhizobiaceae bacterium]